MCLHMHVLEEEIAALQEVNRAIAALVEECKEILGERVQASKHHERGGGAASDGSANPADLHGVGPSHEGTA